jgi:hypothetical protein
MCALAESTTVDISSGEELDEKQVSKAKKTESGTKSSI